MPTALRHHFPNLVQNHCFHTISYMGPLFYEGTTFHQRPLPAREFWRLKLYLFSKPHTIGVENEHCHLSGDQSMFRLLFESLVDQVVSVFVLRWEWIRNAVFG
jgi:hypothetical protein